MRVRAHRVDQPRPQARLTGVTVSVVITVTAVMTVAVIAVRAARVFHAFHHVLKKAFTHVTRHTHVQLRHNNERVE